MTDRESGERLRAAFAAWLEIAENGADCPPPERLWDAANGKLDRNAAADLLLHCGECGVCAEGWRLARIDAPDAVSDPGAARSRFGQVVAVAAVLAFVGLAGLLIPKLVRKTEPVFRQIESSAVAPTSDERLPRDRCQLSWSPVSDDSRYDLRVMTEDLDTLHAAWNLIEARATIPPDALDAVTPGSRILWQVTVRSSEGDTEVSETFSTVID